VRAALLLSFLLALASAAAAVSPTGVGGGGWLHSGALLPSDAEVLVVGADVSGVYRTDDFGLSWRPWNEGLPNTDEKETHFVQDLEGVARGGWVGFYAATQGGIYRAAADGAWECMTPVPEYSYRDTQAWHADEIPFSCLDWDEDSTLVAGAGLVSWNTSYEENYYPGLPGSRFSPYGDFTEQWTVWTLDLASPGSSWLPDSASTFGAARDIAAARIDDTTYVAVATPSGIYLESADGWSEVAAPLYDAGLTCWTLHLTRRGTLYAAVGRGAGTPSSPSGVYRMFDVRGRSSWQWVGDSAALPPNGSTLDEIGTHAELINLSVLDGQGAAPDTLFLGSRNTSDGLFRGLQSYDPADSTCTWEHKIYSKAGPTFWYVDGSGEEKPLDVGWHTEYGLGVIFPPVVSKFHPGRVAVQLSGRMHVSQNGGDTWTQSYTESDGGCWRSRGYNELCNADLDFTSDGRAVQSNGDNGVFVSCDASLEAWERLHPPVSSGASAQSDTAWSHETGEICVRHDWLGSGEDAIFVVSGDLMQGASPCKLFMVDAPGDWTHVTSGLDSDRYVFHDIAFASDDTCFVPYARYDGRVGSGSSIEEFGVLRGTYDGANWSWQPVNSGLEAVTSPTTVNAVGVQLLFNDRSGKLFLAARQRNVRLSGQSSAISVPGGLYVLERPSGSSWRLEFGGPGTDWRDFRCLAQSADGSVLYAGTRGRSGAGWGSVLICENPSDAATTWTPLANTDETGYPFGFVPPFWATSWSVEYANRTLTDVRALAVAPWNPHTVYVGLSCVGFMEKEGLWVYNSGGDGAWEHLSDGQTFEGQGVVSLAFGPATLDRLAIGTHGLELYEGRVGATTGIEEPLPGGGGAGLRLRAIAWRMGGREVTFHLSLDRRARARLAVFDAMGRKVFSAPSASLPAGRSALRWDGLDDEGRPCPSGVYVAVVRAGEESARGKFTIVR